MVKILYTGVSTCVCDSVPECRSFVFFIRNDCAVIVVVQPAATKVKVRLQSKDRCRVAHVHPRDLDDCISWFSIQDRASMSTLLLTGLISEILRSWYPHLGTHEHIEPFAASVVLTPADIQGRCGCCELGAELGSLVSLSKRQFCSVRHHSSKLPCWPIAERSSRQSDARVRWRDLWLHLGFGRTKSGDYRAASETVRLLLVFSLRYDGAVCQVERYTSTMENLWPLLRTERRCMLPPTPI